MSYLPIPDNAIPQYKQVTITSAQLLDIFATPVTLIPAPSNGSIIKATSIVCKMINNTTPYTSNGLYFKIDTTVVAADSVILGLLGSANRDVLLALPASIGENKALTATSVVANPTLGDGDLVVGITYQIIQI